MLSSLFENLFEGFVISEEKENIYTYSLGWKNLKTIYCITLNGCRTKIDFRLAFTDVTLENLIDFIDYKNLQNELSDNFEDYFIVYLGLFRDDFPKHRVGDQFLIDKSCKKINQLYYNLERDFALLEFIKNTYSDEFNQLKPIYVNLKSLSSTSNINKFGLRFSDIEKKDWPGKPLISIIIPTYNSESIIEQALQSALAQNYENKEIIVVDGGSSDATSTIVKKYEDLIDWFNSEPDKNIFDAINKGTRASKGRYSIFIGSDDLLFPNALKSFVDGLKEDEIVDFAYGNFLNLHPAGRIKLIKTFINSRHYGKFQIGHPAMFIRKFTFEELEGFNDEYYICADADFELKLITNNKVSRKLNDNICIFRGGGHSSFKMQNVKQVYQIFKKYKALNSEYYYFAARMQLYNIFIIIFGKKALSRLISIFK